MLYAADFHNGKVDVFNATFGKVQLDGQFKDPNLAAGFAPFGVQSIGKGIFVTYAKQNATASAQVVGAGFGILDEFESLSASKPSPPQEFSSPALRWSLFRCASRSRRQLAQEASNFDISRAFPRGRKIPSSVRETRRLNVRAAFSIHPTRLLLVTHTTTITRKIEQEPHWVRRSTTPKSGLKPPRYGRRDAEARPARVSFVVPRTTT